MKSDLWKFCSDNSYPEDVKKFILFNIDQISGYLTYCYYQKYHMIADGTDWSTIFNVLLEKKAKDFTNYGIDVAIPSLLSSTTGLAPLFRNINPIELYELRSSPPFEYFRKAIRNIDLFIRDYKHSNLEIQQYMKDELYTAKNELEKYQKKSGFFQKMIEGFIDVPLNAIGGSILASKIYSPAADPLWFLLVTGATTLSASAIGHEIKARLEGKNDKGIGRLIANINF